MNPPHFFKACLRAAGSAATSMETGLALFLLVAAVAIVGSFFPALSEAIYGSWPFAALLAALAANTLACLIAKRPGLDRARSSKGAPRLRALCVFAIHLSILAIAAAGLWASLAFTSERLDVAEGESFQVEGRSYRLDSIKVDYYPDGSVSDWVSALSCPGGLKGSVRVNHPLSVSGARILQTGYGRRYSVVLSLPKEGVVRNVELDEKALMPLSKDGSVGILLARPASEKGGRSAELSLVSEGRPLLAATLREGEPAALGDTGIEITLAGSRAYGSYILRRTPGIAALWAAFALLASSVCGLLIDPKGEKDA